MSANTSQRRQVKEAILGLNPLHTTTATKYTHACFSTPFSKPASNFAMEGQSDFSARAQFALIC